MLSAECCFSPPQRPRFRLPNQLSISAHPRLKAFILSAIKSPLGRPHGTDFWGVGGRLGFNLSRFAQLEGDFAWDFSQQFPSTNALGTKLGTNTTSNLRLLHGLFGPRFQTGIGPVKGFLVLKGGFLNFGVSGLSGAAFRNQVGNVPGGDTNGVFYPGVGLEFGSKVGLRAEVGDEMYFDRGANHNLKLNFGPQIRF